MDLDYSIRLDANRNILLTEISRRTFDEQALEDLDSDYGFFVVLEDTVEGTFEVLAKAASVTAGHSLIGMLLKAPSGPFLMNEV